MSKVLMCVGSPYKLVCSALGNDTFVIFTQWLAYSEGAWPNIVNIACLEGKRCFCFLRKCLDDRNPVLFSKDYKPYLTVKAVHPLCVT